MFCCLLQFKRDCYLVSQWSLFLKSTLKVDRTKKNYSILKNALGNLTWEKYIKAHFPFVFLLRFLRDKKNGEGV